jgi:metal-dependent amidase/aminoacylase/carboxypeptidase family protein
LAIKDWQKAAETRFEEMVRVRRDFHRYPEIGFEETRTAGIVAEKLTSLGLEVQQGIGQTGVVALLEGSRR